jgi:hypothetical protein
VPLVTFQTSSGATRLQFLVSRYCLGFGTIALLPLGPLASHTMPRFSVWMVAGTISWAFRIARMSNRGSQMAAGDQHRIKAAEFNTRAQSEARPQLRVQFENLAKAHLRLAKQADLNDRVEAVDDLCRELGATGAKSKWGPYEPPRPRSAMETEQVASIKKRRGRMTRTDLSEIAKGIPLAVTLLALAV